MYPTTILEKANPIELELINSLTYLIGKMMKSLFTTVFVNPRCRDYGLYLISIYLTIHESSVVARSGNVCLIVVAVLCSGISRTDCLVPSARSSGTTVSSQSTARTIRIFSLTCASSSVESCPSAGRHWKNLHTRMVSGTCRMR